MLITLRSLFALLACLGAISTASAQVLPPLSNLRVVPEPSMEGTVLSARLLFRYECRFIEPNPPPVTVQGHVVKLEHELISGPCIGVPPAPIDIDFPIGALAPGSYTLVYAPTSQQQIYEVQSIQFTVFGTSNTSAIPALNSKVMLLAALACALIGAFACRNRY
jgi:hypothetical protein